MSNYESLGTPAPGIPAPTSLPDQQSSSPPPPDGEPRPSLDPAAELPPPDADPPPDDVVKAADLPGLASSGQRRRRPGKRLVAPQQPTPPLTPEQRLLLLDTWRRSGLPAGDFAPLVGVSKHTLYAWQKKFTQQGPAGLVDQPRGAATGSRLPELTKRTILMLKQAHPDFGCQKISDLLLRGPALPASPAAVARVLHEAGYQLEEVPTRTHAAPVRRFERARPNQLWQTDLFTFMLKRQNRRG